jgi:hypothetical protein
MHFLRDLCQRERHQCSPGRGRRLVRVQRGKGGGTGEEEGERDRPVDQLSFDFHLGPQRQGEQR